MCYSVPIGKGRDVNIDIQEIAYHRNGSWGEGFYVARFYDRDLNREMVATVFGYNPKCYRDTDNPGQFYNDVYEDPHVAVLDVTLASQTIAFGANSWRGGDYAGDLYDAIDEHAAAESERLYA